MVSTRKALVYGAIASALSALAGYNLGHFGALTAQPPAPNRPQDVAAVPVPSTPQITKPREHNYDVHEGVDYGYTAMLSADQQRAGQAANTVVMVSYAGERNGRYQVHSRTGNVLRAFECAAPCDVIRVMAVIDADDLRQEVQMEYLRNTPGTIAAMALEDAMHGRLEPYAEYQGKRRYELWVDQANGLTRKRIADADKPLSGR